METQSLVKTNCFVHRSNGNWLAEQVGLHKPHTPYAYPSTIDSMYPPAEKIALPTAAARRVPVGMPDVAWEHCSAITPFNESTFMPDLPTQQHRRAYCELAARYYLHLSVSAGALSFVQHIFGN